MLTPYSRSQFIEKILTDQAGRQYRVLFLVSLIDGEVKGRLISAELVSVKALTLGGEVSEGSLTLAAYTRHAPTDTAYVAPVAPFVSPYFDIELILNSQPTRAPSLA